MQAAKNVASMKNRLIIYRLGLRKAESGGNPAEISKWEDSIAALEREIAECGEK